MYLWKVKKLAKDLKEGSVSEKEKFKYLFALSIYDVSYYLSSSNNPVINYFNLIGNMGAIIVTAIGLYYCFKANNHGDNKDFLERYICLSLPIKIRIGVIEYIVLFWGTSIIARNTVAFDIFFESLYIISYVAEFIWIRHYLVEITKNKF